MEERKKNKGLIWLIVVLIVLMFVGMFVSYKLLTKKDKHETSDDTNQVYYVYKKDTLYKVFDKKQEDSSLKLIDTYDCSQLYCPYLITEENLMIINDKDVVYYKNLNDKEDFKKVSRTNNISYTDTISKTDYSIDTYEISNEYYYVIGKNNEEKIMYNSLLYNSVLETTSDILFDYNTLKDGYVLYYNQDEFWDDVDKGYIYDVKNNKKMHDLNKDLENYTYPTDRFEKIGGFYKITPGTEAATLADLIYSSDFKLITEDDGGLFLGNGYYINDKTIYYIKNDVLNIKDSNGISKDNLNDIDSALLINSYYLLYFGQNNNIKIYDLKNSNIVVDSDISFDKENFSSFEINDNKFIIKYKDASAKEYSDWNQIANDYFNSDDNQGCLPESASELQSGYVVEFNMKNEMLKKEIAVVEDVCIM